MFAPQPLCIQMCVVCNNVPVLHCYITLLVKRQIFQNEVLTVEK
jgi:hypothetical protein